MDYSRTRKPWLRDQFTRSFDSSSSRIAASSAAARSSSSHSSAHPRIARASSLEGDDGEQADQDPQRGRTGDDRQPAVPERSPLPVGLFRIDQRLAGRLPKRLRERAPFADVTQDRRGDRLRRAAMTAENVLHQILGKRIRRRDLPLAALERAVDAIESDLALHQHCKRQPRPVLEPPLAPGRHRHPLVKPAWHRRAAGGAIDQDVRDLVPVESRETAIGIARHPRRQQHHHGTLTACEPHHPRRRRPGRGESSGASTTVIGAPASPGSSRPTSRRTGSSVCGAYPRTSAA